MRIQQIRNATLKVEYGGNLFLVDPWLAAKGEMGSFQNTGYRCENSECDTVPMPCCELPLPLPEILSDVDAYIVTHIHPDHIDMGTDGHVGSFLDKQLPIFAQNVGDAKQFLNSGFTDVTVLFENSTFRGTDLIKTPTRHGTKVPMDPACGLIMRAEGEKTLYLAGDTIMYEGVRQSLKRFNPEVVVVNACAATLRTFGRLIMDDQDIEAVHETLPQARIVISHMETVAHATIDRAEMRKRMQARGLTDFVCMPADGESILI